MPRKSSRPLNELPSQLQELVSEHNASIEAAPKKPSKPKAVEKVDDKMDILIGPGRFYRTRAEYEYEEAGILARHIAREQAEAEKPEATGDGAVDDYETALADLTREVERFVKRVREGAWEWPQAFFDTFERTLFTHAVDKRTFRKMIYQYVAELREHEQQASGYGIYAPDVFFVNPQLLVRHFVAVQTFGREAAEIEATTRQLASLTPDDSAFENLHAKWMRFHQRELLRDLLARGFKQWSKEIRMRYPLPEETPVEGLFPRTTDWPVEKKYRAAGALVEALVNAQCVDPETDRTQLQQHIAGLIPQPLFPAEWKGKPKQFLVLVKSLLRVVNSATGEGSDSFSQNGLIIRCVQFFGLQGRRGYAVNSVASRISQSHRTALEDRDPTLHILAQWSAFLGEPGTDF